MSYNPIRGGTRGGKDQFQWDEVKEDKHRENYLGLYIHCTCIVVYPLKLSRKKVL